MFQRVDGVEVCLFSMYVQEYGADAPYFNARRAYISYLDSGDFFWIPAISRRALSFRFSSLDAATIGLPHQGSLDGVLC